MADHKLVKDGPIWCWWQPALLLGIGIPLPCLLGFALVVWSHLVMVSIFQAIFRKLGFLLRYNWCA